MRMRIVLAVTAGLVTGVLTMAGTVTPAGAASSCGSPAGRRWSTGAGWT